MKKVYLALPSKVPEAHKNSLRQLIEYARTNPLLQLVIDFHWFEEAQAGLIESMFEEDIEAIEKCDFLVAEISYPSSGVGFQIAYALSRKKKVLCLYEHGLSRSVSTFLKSLPEQYVQTAKYTPETLLSILQTYFATAKPFKLHKFNFIISEKIKDYLAWLASDSSQSVSEKLRFLVEKRVIDKDKDYQAFLQNKLK